ncbi:MAG: hypothetical protein IKD22_04560, partial [Lentisphaeria bacterium]|nr:hypothetical protein [Lentisphaeria bacterium]
MKVQFGTARAVTTPTEPISLAGYFNRRVWDHIKDDLHVRVLALKDGDQTCAIIHIDILSIPYALYSDILDAIKAAGIPLTEDNLIIAATHTHTAPNTGAEPNSPQYRQLVARQAAAALKEALANLREGEVYSGMTTDMRFMFNRRYWMKDGRVVTNPGKLNPDILRPEGEIDPEIPLIAIKTAAGIEVLISSCVNHTDTIGGCGVSADWPGFLVREVEPVLAPGALMIPMVGASGNINHFDVSTDMDQTCYAEPERIGKGYAEKIIAALPTLKPINGSGLKFASTIVSTGVRELDPVQVAEAQAVMAKYPDIDVDNPQSIKDMTSEDLAKGAPFALKYFANALLKIANNTNGPKFRLCGIKFGDDTYLV